MKLHSTCCSYLYVLGILLFLFAGCDEIKKEPPEKLNPVNPLDPQYSESAPSPEKIEDMNVAGPALILDAPDTALQSGYVFPVYLLAKDLENIIGISAHIQLPNSVKIISVSKDSTYFCEGAEGMAFYVTPISDVNAKNQLTISVTRLGGTPQGFTGNSPVASIIAKVTTGEDATFAFDRTENSQLRSVDNDTISLENLESATVEME